MARRPLQKPGQHQCDNLHARLVDSGNGHQFGFIAFREGGANGVSLQMNAHLDLSPPSRRLRCICHFAIHDLSDLANCAITQGLTDQGSDSCRMQGSSSQTKSGPAFVPPSHIRTPINWSKMKPFSGSSWCTAVHMSSCIRRYGSVPLPQTEVGSSPPSTPSDVSIRWNVVYRHQRAQEVA